MKKRTMLVSLFVLIFLVGCADITDSDEDATKGSQVSSTQSVSKPETGSDIVTSEESASLTFADEEMELYVRKLAQAPPGRDDGGDDAERKAHA